MVAGNRAGSRCAGKIRAKSPAQARASDQVHLVCFAPMAPSTMKTLRNHDIPSVINQGSQQCALS